MIKFSYAEVYTNFTKIIKTINFSNLTGIQALIEFIENKIIYELACIWAYNRKFWTQNNLEFAVRKIS